MEKFNKTFILLLESNIQKYKNFNKNIYMQEIEIIKIKNGENKRKCPYCKKILSSLLNYHKHIKKLICKKEIKNICNFCNKYFSRKSNYDYHITNNVCVKYKKDIDIINLNCNVQIPEVKDVQEIQQIKQIKQVKIKKNITNNITNNNNSNNTTNNTTNNIQNNQQNIIIAVNNKNDIAEVCKQVSKLIPFRYTKYNTPVDILIDYYNNPNRAIQHIVNYQHFNPKKPQQMNIHNTNCRSNRVQVFDEDENGDERWITKDKMDVCEDLYEKSVNELYFAKYKLEKKGIIVDPQKENRMNEKINELETDDKIRKEYINKIADITWDGRNIVNSNKKNILL